MRPNFLTRFLLASAITALAFFPHSAHADPETGEWTDVQSGAIDRTVDFNETIRYAITANTDSKLFKVVTPVADLCFDADTLGIAGSARVSVYRVIEPATTTINGSILLPTVPIDNSDCVVLVVGTYWVEVTAGPTGGETPVVTVTGRTGS